MPDESIFWTAMKMGQAYMGHYDQIWSAIFLKAFVRVMPDKHPNVTYRAHAKRLEEEGKHQQFWEEIGEFLGYELRDPPDIGFQCPEIARALAEKAGGPTDPSVYITGDRYIIRGDGKLTTRNAIQVASIRDWFARCSFYSRLRDTNEENLHMSANDIQIGGSHYRKGKVQHWDWAENIPYLEGCATKYIGRWRDKEGLKDLLKGLHYLQKIFEVNGFSEKIRGVLYESGTIHIH